jgi:hypothetical protein
MMTPVILESCEVTNEGCAVWPVDVDASSSLDFDWDLGIGADLGLCVPKRERM